MGKLKHLHKEALRINRVIEAHSEKKPIPRCGEDFSMVFPGSLPDPEKASLLGNRDSGWATIRSGDFSGLGPLLTRSI